MIALLKLYPREWRERYGRELEEIVAAQPRSLRLAVDLLAGAIDAHLKPQLTTGRRTGAPTPEGGEPMLDRLRHGDTAALSKRESLISAALTLGGSMAIAVLLMLWDEDPLLKTIALSMLPGVWMLAIQPFYLRGHSTISKVVLLGGPLLVLFLIGLVAGLMVEG